VLPPNADSPNRPPDWRWERARWYQTNQKRAVKKEDPYVLLLVRYQAAKKKATTDEALLNLETKFPGLYNAQLIFESPTLKAVRWGLEARILSRQPMEEIATRTGLSADTVLWYECAFFNVLDKLNSPDYVASVVIGETLHRGVTPRDYNLLWKLYGYAGGVAVLDAVISQRVPPGVARNWLNDDSVGVLTLKMNVAARTVPVAFNHAVVFDTYLRLQQAVASGEAMPTSSYAGQVRDILSAVSGAITGGDEVPVDADRYTQYDASAGELRAHEMLAISAGIGTPPASVTELAFPAQPQASSTVGG